MARGQTAQRSNEYRSFSLRTRETHSQKALTALTKLRVHLDQHPPSGLK